MIRRGVFVIILLPLLIANSTLAAYSEEIVVEISGNGGGSDNTVEVSVKEETNVEQNNEAHIENNVSNDANTGDNEANSNTGGEVVVQTGDVTAETHIENSNVNTNHAETGCNCNQTVVSKTSGNGSKSTNTSLIETHNTVVTSQNNKATIVNNVKTYGNTGNNNANYNSGNVVIKTGDIFAESTIVNKNINNSIDLTGLSDSEVLIAVFGNGSFSNNIAAFEQITTNVHTSNNNADITNNEIAYLNSGGNAALGNVGDVLMVTGDIVVRNTIVNENINSNYVEVACGCKTGDPEEPEIPEITPPPTTPPHHSGTKSENGDDGNGGVGGTSVSGDILPATGSLATILMTLSALILFFAGWYLRFRSGLAPGMTI